MSVYRPAESNGKRSNLYVVQFRDHRGLVRRLHCAARSKSIARQHEKNLLDLVDRRAVDHQLPMPKYLSKYIERLPDRVVVRLCEWGVLDSSVTLASRQLSRHLDDWKSFMADSGGSPRTTGETHIRAKKVVEWCGWKRWSDVRSSDVMRFRAYQTKSDVGTQTRNHYLAAVKQFFRWLEADGRCGASPLAYLSCEDVSRDIRRRRRAISMDEFQQLIDAAAQGPIRRGIPGAERAMIYWFAGHTGLRRSEIESLLCQDMDLDGDIPFVRLRKTKTKTGATTPIPLFDAGLVGALRLHIKGKSPAGALFNVPDRNYSAKMIAADLKTCGIEYETDEGYCDFHSLRHFADAHLKRSGVSLQVIQRRMRHASMSMTLDRYGLATMQDEVDAMRSVAAIQPPASLVS